MSIPPPPPPQAGPPGPPAGLPVAPAPHVPGPHVPGPHVPGPHVPGPHVPGPAGAAVTAGAAPAAATPLAAWQAAVAVVAGLALVGGIGWAGMSAVKAFDAATPTAAPTAAAPVPAPTDPGATPDATPGATPEVDPSTPAPPPRVDRSVRPTTWRVTASDVAGEDIGERWTWGAQLLDDSSAALPTRTIVGASSDGTVYLAGVDLATGEVAWRRQHVGSLYDCTVIDAARATCAAFTDHAAVDGELVIFSLDDGSVLGTVPTHDITVVGTAPHPDGLLVVVRSGCTIRLMVVPPGGGDPIRTVEGPDLLRRCELESYNSVTVNEKWVVAGWTGDAVVADRTTLEIVASTEDGPEEEAPGETSARLALAGSGGWILTHGSSTTVGGTAVDGRFAGQALRSAGCSPVPTSIVVGTERVMLDGSSRVPVADFAVGASQYDVTSCDWGAVVSDAMPSEGGTGQTVVDAAGSTLWSRPVPGFGLVVAAPDALIFEDVEEIRAYRTTDGTELWTLPVPKISDAGFRSLWSFGNAIVAGDDGYAELYVFPVVP